MGWWSLLKPLQKAATALRPPLRVVGLEEMESRRNMAATPVQLGAIYLEEDSGSDLHGDTFQIMFEGGETGTQLHRLTINTDHSPTGRSVGDLIFDTFKGGWGADEAFELQVISQTGIEDVRWQVVDGGTQLQFDFVGFEAGEKLIFSIDVDEVQDYDPAETNQVTINESIDPITSGVEFQGSLLQATFVHPNYFDVSGEGEFRNVYDPLFAGTNLLQTTRTNGLPNDDFLGKRDRSTGVMLPLQQEPKPVSIRGHVRLTDRFGNCDETAVDAKPLKNVRVQLFDAAGKLVHTTTTNAAGEYLFDNLAPGNYTIVELTPEALIDGDEHLGTVQGNPRGALTANDKIVLELAAGEQGIDYDFCEHQPGEISGYVYHDEDNDGQFDAGEKAIANVTIELQDDQGNSIATTTTDANGFYLFRGLAAGKYRVVEFQPPDYSDGLDTPGTILSETVGRANNPGDLLDQIALHWGDRGIDYNFGELRVGSLSGQVFVDSDGDCIFEAGELPLAGVVVELLDASGNVIRTTTSNSLGLYEFTDLPAGNYAVRETQPVRYFHGGQTVGSHGGDATTADLISGISLPSGANLTHYNFCEIPAASISGFVFRDGATILTPDGKAPSDLAKIRDGQLTHDDVRLSGVVIELRQTQTGRPIRGEETLPGTNPAGPLRTVTDANGYYEFRGLRLGDYTVIEIHPDAYIDSFDTAGTVGGLTLNAGADTPELEQHLATFEALGIDLNHDAILRIVLFAGDHSANNNFSEVLVSPTYIPPETPEDPLQPPPKAVIPPFNEPLPLELVPTPQTEELLSGRASRSYTWHLSLIDGGNPRVTESTTRLNGTVWKPASTLDRSAWKAEYAQDGEWLIRVGDQTKKFRFGMPGATPLTGDFNGDGHADLAFFLDGEWFLDLNSNGRWDAEDLWAKLGSKHDRPVVGDWDGDGKDDIGIYGPEWVGDLRHIEAEPGLPDADNHQTRAKRPKNVPPDPVDATNGERLLKATAKTEERADLIDHVFRFGQPTDLPVAGDWNGDGIASIGIFRQGKWHFDNDGDGRWSEGDTIAHFGRPDDLPLVGDWDGNGKDEIGVYRAGEWIFDSNGNQQLDDADQRLLWGEPGHLPIVGDWNGDGADEPGLYRDDVKPEAPPAAEGEAARDS